jgi:hypothetical protein
MVSQSMKENQSIVSQYLILLETNYVMQWGGLYKVHKNMSSRPVIYAFLKLMNFVSAKQFI